jgi:hypothetical protein
MLFGRASALKVNDITMAMMLMMFHIMLNKKTGIKID